MIIVKLSGGLGNQMFQYATGRRLACANNTDLKLDISSYQGVDPNYRYYALSNFNIKEVIASKEEVAGFKKTGVKKLFEKLKPYRQRAEIKERQNTFDPKILELKGSRYLNGYWQTEKYFYSIEDKIRDEFTLKSAPSKKFYDVADAIKRSHSVSLHIRRGDYLSPKFSSIYATCSEEYYRKAIEMIRQKDNDMKLFIFSDDADYVRKNFKLAIPSIFIGDLGIFKDYEEIVLMSYCRHNIIANSTFGWWGAWLNQNPQKIVISPKKWYKTWIYDEKDLVPEKWQTII